MKTRSGAAKCPCYYVSGNHEFWSGKADDFKNILAAFGVRVLAGTTGDLEVRGDKIKICGIDDPDNDRYPSHSVLYAEQIDRLGESIDHEIFTVLLSHRPERIAELLPLSSDLVLSGHAHGGQWRIPFILEKGYCCLIRDFSKICERRVFLWGYFTDLYRKLQI